MSILPLLTILVYCFPCSMGIGGSGGRDDSDEVNKQYLKMHEPEETMVLFVNADLGKCFKKHLYPMAVPLHSTVKEFKEQLRKEANCVPNEKLIVTFEGMELAAQWKLEDCGIHLWSHVMVTLEKKDEPTTLPMPSWPQVKVTPAKMGKPTTLPKPWQWPQDDVTPAEKGKPTTLPKPWQWPQVDVSPANKGEPKTLPKPSQVNATFAKKDNPWSQIIANLPKNGKVKVNATPAKDRPETLPKPNQLWSQNNANGKPAPPVKPEYLSTKCPRRA